MFRPVSALLPTLSGRAMDKQQAYELFGSDSDDDDDEPAAAPAPAPAPAADDDDADADLFGDDESGRAHV